ncbi:MAG TPA: hypothetical protein VHC46_00650 [Thermodesulfobacteriota bacterium]|jgi:hypothetical protein|nr:hypothetical protein [Thermodesulfobacteriota bacterium]
MKAKVLEKAYVLGLRKNGLSYSEILRRVPVAKSTLSRWLGAARFSETENRTIREHMEARAKQGLREATAASRARREKRDRALGEEMHALYHRHRDDPFFTAGIALFWGRGVEEGGALFFTDGDTERLGAMVHWFRRYLGVSPAQFHARAYGRDSSAPSPLVSWLEGVGVPKEHIRRTAYRSSGTSPARARASAGSLRLELTRGLYGRKMRFLVERFLEDYRKGSTVR